MGGGININMYIYICMYVCVHTHGIYIYLQYIESIHRVVDGKMSVWVKFVGKMSRMCTSTFGIAGRFQGVRGFSSKLGYFLTCLWGLFRRRILGPGSL